MRYSALIYCADLGSIPSSLLGRNFSVISISTERPLRLLTFGSSSTPSLTSAIRGRHMALMAGMLVPPLTHTNATMYGFATLELPDSATQSRGSLVRLQYLLRPQTT
jgi:hypothetical protein